jgi:hypothetical protein
MTTVALSTGLRRGELLGSLARCRAPRPSSACAASVRSERDHDAQEQGRPEGDPARRGRPRSARGAVRVEPASGTRFDRLSAIRRSARHSTRRSSRNTREWRWTVRGSRRASDRGMGFDTRRSRRRPRPESRRCSSRRRRATPRARRRSATFTPHGRATRTRLNWQRLVYSAQRYQVRYQLLKGEQP